MGSPSHERISDWTRTGHRRGDLHEVLHDRATQCRERPRAVRAEPDHPVERALEVGRVRVTGVDLEEQVDQLVHVREGHERAGERQVDGVGVRERFGGDRRRREPEPELGEQCGRAETFVDERGEVGARVVARAREQLLQERGGAAGEVGTVRVEAVREHAGQRVGGDVSALVGALQKA